MFPGCSVVGDFFLAKKSPRAGIRCLRMPPGHRTPVLCARRAYDAPTLALRFAIHRVRHLALMGGLFVVLGSPCLAAAQTPPNVLAGQTIPMGERVRIAENVRYGICGTAVTLWIDRIGGHRTASGGIRSTTATFCLTGARGKIQCVTTVPSSTHVRTWRGLEFLVYAIDRAGFAEMRVVMPRWRTQP